MLKLNRIHCRGLVALSMISILWRCTSVHASGVFTPTSTDEARRDEIPPQTAFSINLSASGEDHKQEILSVQEPPPPHQPSTLCTDPPPGHCEFYRDCLESKFHCGPSGYPLGYGEKFCQKFVAGKDHLTPAGQEWMLGTMQCLQRVLVPDATEPGAGSGSGFDVLSTWWDMDSHASPLELKETRCEALKEKAFNSHSRCYLDNGLCALSGKDWVNIVEIIGIRTLFDSWAAIKESIEAAEGCL